MKNYTKEEIAKIVSDVSKSVIDNNVDIFLARSKEVVKDKNNRDAIFHLFALTYREAQKNCEDTIIEVLNKILND